jgi:trans-2,3-dihydro-3-hydroxyanthranilate isomerase
MKRRFVTLDVFTTRRFAGNPLAVVLDADGLDTHAMQAVAREFNLSETVLVLPPKDPAHRAALRIFTPGRELPFAGHPTVGTAVLLGLLDGGEQERELILAEEVGPVRCRVSRRGGEGGHAVFQIPRLPAEGSRPPGAATIAAAIGLSGSDVGFDNLAAVRWSAGNPFTFVPLASRDAVARCRPDLARFDSAFGGDEIAAPFVFSGETSEAGNHFHARMFAPNFGIAEDPATGSAAAAFAGYLAASGRYGDGDHVVRIEQGYEMGRPSLIILTMTLQQGRLVAASIGGDAVVVSEGTIEA